MGMLAAYSNGVRVQIEYALTVNGEITYFKSLSQCIKKYISITGFINIHGEYTHASPVEIAECIIENDCYWSANFEKGELVSYITITRIMYKCDF